MRRSREYSVAIGDDRFKVIEWAGESDPVLLLHATGFHSRCWSEVVRNLPESRVLALDLRFHGMSTGEGVVDWKLMTEDVRRVMQQLDLRRVVGVGHSIGGHLILRAAVGDPERFKHLLLIDPVIFSPQDYDAMSAAVAGLTPRDHPVSRRRNRWRDAREMFDHFRDRHPFSTWQPQVLQDYCDYALRPRSEEEYRALACDPLNEAGIYLQAAHHRDILANLTELKVPVTLLRAPPGPAKGADLSASPTWPGLAAALPDCREIYLPDLNHFIPMQDPELVARTIREIG